MLTNNPEGGRPVLPPPSKRRRHYYEGTGREHDDLLRCNDCGRLVTYAALFSPHHNGLTPCCGTRRVRAIQALTPWEWLKVRVGLINFPKRAEFLKEFSRG